MMTNVSDLPFQNFNQLTNSQQHLSKIQATLIQLASTLHGRF